MHLVRLDDRALAIYCSRQSRLGCLDDFFFGYSIHGKMGYPNIDSDMCLPYGIIDQALCGDHSSFWARAWQNGANFTVAEGYIYCPKGGGDDLGDLGF